ncbi:MAG: hypothetical protein EOP92_40445, partial [Lysobacteraceae bacterium]
MPGMVAALRRGLLVGAEAAIADDGPAQLPVELPPALVAELVSLAEACEASLQTVLLASWGLLLARVCGQDRLALAFRQAGGGKSSAVAGDASVDLWVDVSEAPSLAMLAATIEGQLRGNGADEQARDAEMGAGAAFTWCAEGAATDLADAGMAGGEAGAALELRLGLDAGSVCGFIACRESWLPPAQLQRLAGYLRELLQSMVGSARQPVDRLSLLDATQRRQAIEHGNDTAAVFPDTLCIHELFEAQVARTPEAIALVHG